MEQNNVVNNKKQTKTNKQIYINHIGGGMVRLLGVDCWFKPRSGQTKIVFAASQLSTQH
jgi:hypothetical protein